MIDKPSTVKKVEGWNYTVGPSGELLNLLTIGGRAVQGVWHGKLGEFYLGWYHMLKRDKALEEKLFPHLIKNDLKAHFKQISKS